MCMQARHEQQVRRHRSEAAIVCDLFHLKSKYGREVIERVRMEEANRLEEDKPAGEGVKGAKWLLLRSSENLLRTEHCPGILAHCRHHLNTSALGGLDNAVNVIKRVAYGFRDNERFFLRKREAFPGTPG